MKHSFLFVMLFVPVVAMTACHRLPPKGLVQQMIEPHKEIAHPLLYWETVGDRSTLYEMPENTSNVRMIRDHLQGFLQARSSKDVVYLLSEDRDGYLKLSRLESDRDMITEVALEHRLKRSGDSVWKVTRGDVVALAGVDDSGTSHAITITFSRKEGEPANRPDQGVNPQISWTEAEWYSSPDQISGIAISPDATMVAVLKKLDDGSDKSGLFMIRSPGSAAVRVGQDPADELGDFSPDGKSLLATFEVGQTVELYMVASDSGDMERLTTSASGFRNSRPAWHPSGKYIIYTTDYTSSFTRGAAHLSGEQLYLYSIDSRNARLLTAFTGMTVWVDIAPNGDFLLYSSTPGIPARRAGRGAIQHLPDQAADNQDSAGKYETWRLYYVPWVPEDFVSSNPNILTPEQTQFLVSWTVGAEDKIGFAWGPGGEWIPPENRPQ